MADATSLLDSREYVLTDVGRALLADHDVCECEWLMVIDGTNACIDCGTVYGLTFAFAGFGSFPRRTRNRRVRTRS